MSGVKGVRHADHRIAADQARQLPGEWVLAATYNSSSSAKAAARAVRRGAELLRFYGPAGSFDARAELTQDGADLWVSYVDKDALASRDCADSIASGLMEDLDAFSRRMDATHPTRSSS